MPSMLSKLSKLLPLFVLSALGSSSHAFAQGSPPDEADIRAIVQSETDAWNRGDAEAFGKHYAQNGSFTNVIGQQFYGRPAFIARHAQIFSTIYKNSHLTQTIGKITFLRPDVAVVDIDGAVLGAQSLPPGLQPLADGALHNKLQQVMTREKNGWFIAAFHDVAVYPLPSGGPPK